MASLVLEIGRIKLNISSNSRVFLVTLSSDFSKIFTENDHQAAVVVVLHAGLTPMQRRCWPEG